MNWRRAVATGSLLMCAMGVAVGQAPGSGAAEAPTRIVVIEFQNAVTATNEFQREFAVVQKKFEPKRVELKNLNDEIDRLTKQVQADGAKLSDSEQAERARTIENKQKQAQRLADDDQNDYQQALQEVLNRVAQKVGDELTTFAKDHGFTMVIDRTAPEQQAPIVLYASPGMDITKQIVDAYNTKSGVAAPQAAVPSAPAPSAAK
jgi:outer membrane protein